MMGVVSSCGVMGMRFSMSPVLEEADSFRSWGDMVADDDGGR